MNKEKVFIEGHEVGFLVDTTGVREKKIQVASGEIVSIDERFIYKSIEREKVAIPQFVADYIEFKKANDFHVYGAMRVIEDHYDKRVPEWFYENNIETFARAWLDGYEVEKEKRYLVKMKGIDTNFNFFKSSQKRELLDIFKQRQKYFISNTTHPKGTRRSQFRLGVRLPRN